MCPASGYINLVSVFGVLTATLRLGEAVDASLLTGGAPVLAGMVVVNRARAWGVGPARTEGAQSLPLVLGVLFKAVRFVGCNRP